jgi:aryl-alcohol dehydrogenase-like predicted oxidoreductase
VHYRTLGRTGLKVSLLSLGTGGPSNLGQSSGLSQSVQDALIQRALDLGVNLIDTSAGYRESEAILGRALTGVPRDAYVLATKWRHERGDRPVDSQALVDSVDRSLRRLRTDFIDLMQFHGPIPSEYMEVVERFYPVMTRLQEQGKIRYIGFSEQFSADPAHETVLMALKTHPDLWDTIMLKYGILNQYAAKEALPLAAEHNVGIVNMAAVRVKLPDPSLLKELIADWKTRGVIPADSLPAKDPLGWLVHDGVGSVIGAGYKFAAGHRAISTVLTGTANIEHLDSNAAALDEPRLPDADGRRVVELFSHIAEYA